jgi:hypothetical protein
MTKQELVMLIQQEWRCDDHRSNEEKRKATENLIDVWMPDESKNEYKPWESIGVTELQYWRKRYMDCRVQLEWIQEICDKIDFTEPEKYKDQSINEIRRVLNDMNGFSPTETVLNNLAKMFDGYAGETGANEGLEDVAKRLVFEVMAERRMTMWDRISHVRESISGMVKNNASAGVYYPDRADYHLGQASKNLDSFYLRIKKTKQNGQN